MIVDGRDRLAQADGFIGAVLAIEGIADACAILNGPTGCKLHLGETGRDQFRRENDHCDMRWAEEFYFGQDRVPCTYLDDYDYVFGASEKLEYVFPRVAAKGYSYIAVLNSPGAALIGDDLQRYLDWAALDTPTAVLDEPHFTAAFEEGWTEAARRTIAALAPLPTPRVPRTVNLVGLSIWQKHWSGSLAELTRLLGLCGIDVHAALLAGCTVEQIRRLRRATCNVIVHDELGSGLAEYLADCCGMPYVRSAAGAPIGFDATETWIRVACAAVSVDPSPALERIEAHRKAAAEKLNRFSLKTGLPRGAGFGVALEASLAWPLTKWLCEYLAMTPVAIQVSNDDHPFAQQLKDYLQTIGAEAAWNAELSAESPPEVVLSNDAAILRLMSESKLPVGIDLAMPAKDVTHFVTRSVLGASGTMWTLETLCNGLWRLVDEGAARM